MSDYNSVARSAQESRSLRARLSSIIDTFNKECKELGSREGVPHLFGMSFNSAALGIGTLLAAPKVLGMAALINLPSSVVRAYETYDADTDKILGGSLRNEEKAQMLKELVNNYAAHEGLSVPDGLEQDIDDFKRSTQKVSVAERINAGLQLGTGIVAIACALTGGPVLAATAMMAGAALICGENILYNMWSFKNDREMSLKLEQINDKVEGMIHNESVVYSNRYKPVVSGPR